MSLAHVTPYPLTWPVGWERTKWREYKNFKNSTFARGRDRLSTELDRLKAKDCILSTNVPLRLDGQPSGSFNVFSLADPGVAIYFTLHGRQMAMARDQFNNVVANITSLAIAVEYLRGLERHGGGKMMERAFSGFAALPAPGTEPLCWDVLGLVAGEVLTLLDVQDRVARIDAAFRELAKKRHPDVGGSESEMIELTRARQSALKAAGAA